MPDQSPERPRPLSQRLADPELRRLVERFVRRRVPGSEVEDVVQTVLCDALAAERAPEDDAGLRKWLIGITRHKVADLHRHNGRARHVELPNELGAEEPPHSAREWASWAEKQAAGSPEAERTLDWMAREGAGEKLAHIAEDEKLPATQVRQRVSRLRRMMRERWAAELAAVAAVILAVLIAWMWLRRPQPTADPVLPTPAPELSPAPELERAARLRADALEQCEREAWESCLEGLDEAARLDPAGDQSKEVRAARERAARALEEQKSDSKTDVDSKIETERKQAPAPNKAPPQPAPAPKKPVFDQKLLEQKKKGLPNAEPPEPPSQQQALPIDEKR